MIKNIIAGILSGASVLGALWALAGAFVRGVGLAGASLWAKWLGGTVVDNDPSIAYRWGLIGVLAGCFIGGGVGALSGGKEVRAPGVLVGACTAIVGLVTSIGILVFATGTEFLVELISLPAVVVAAGAVALGASVGALVCYVLKRVKEVGNVE
jgi:hypothetical protein